ncbi:MAG: nuclease-related domain-containing protein [Actinomycetota bacterium]
MVVELSDHVGDLLAESRRRMEDAEQDVALWRSQLALASETAETARSKRSLLRRLLRLSSPEERHALLALDEASHRLHEATGHLARVQTSMRQQQTGAAGEDALAEALSGLSDRWTMLRGYRNRRGETDSVLVGPQGVWAVEVKNIRVRLTVDGSRWRYEKLDRWGNVKEEGDATDRTGRTWADQVNDVAEDLRHWLERRNRRLPVRTAVLLLRDQARLGDVRDSPVDLVGTSAEDLLAAMDRHALDLDRPTCDDIVRLVRRDHAFHEQP